MLWTALKPFKHAHMVFSWDTCMVIEYHGVRHLKTLIYEQKRTQIYITMFLHTNTQWFCQGHSLLDLTLHAGVPALWLTAWRYEWRIQTQHAPFPLSLSFLPLLSPALHSFCQSRPSPLNHVPSLSSFFLSGLSLPPCRFQMSLHFSHPSLLLIPSCPLSAQSF